MIGAGATCGRHASADVPTVCKKSVTFGSEGLTFEVCVLRLKRWLVAGRDLAPDARAAHVGLGGPLLRDFTGGLSEEPLEALL